MEATKRALLCRSRSSRSKAMASGLLSSAAPGDGGRPARPGCRSTPIQTAPRPAPRLSASLPASDWALLSSVQTPQPIPVWLGRSSHSDWLLRRPSAHPLLTSPASKPSHWVEGSQRVGSGVKSLFYLATVVVVSSHWSTGERCRPGRSRQSQTEYNRCVGFSASGHGSKGCGA